MPETSGPVRSRWDWWAWTIWWTTFFLALASFVWFWFSLDRLWALFAILGALTVGLFAYSFWTQWLAERRRRWTLASYCHAHAFSYQPWLWWSAFASQFAHLPLLHKGQSAWKVNHLVNGERQGRKFLVLDFRYTASRWVTLNGAIEAGRVQTVLIWTNPPRHDYVLGPRQGLVQGLASWFIGDQVDFASFGLQEFKGDFLTPPNLDRRYRTWVASTQDLDRILPSRFRDQLMSAADPWTIESVAGSLAIYRPSFPWPTANYERIIEEVWELLAELPR